LNSLPILPLYRLLTSNTIHTVHPINSATCTSDRMAVMRYLPHRHCVWGEADDVSGFAGSDGGVKYEEVELKEGSEGSGPI
jgi:hypothetical protein